jgi:predicted transcriptional regulator
MAEQMLSDELIERVRETASAQNRQPAEVVEEAVCKYLAGQRLARFADRMGARAASMGIRDEDVSALVAEVRSENKARVR